MESLSTEDEFMVLPLLRKKIERNTRSIKLTVNLKRTQSETDAAVVTGCAQIRAAVIKLVVLLLMLQEGTRVIENTSFLLTDEP